jgi:hypothetical protein
VRPHGSLRGLRQGSEGRWDALRALSSRPFYPYDGRQAGLLYLPAHWRYTTAPLSKGKKIPLRSHNQTAGAFMISLQGNRYRDLHKRGSFASVRNGGHATHVLDRDGCTSIEFPCRAGTTQHGRHHGACDVVPSRVTAGGPLRGLLLGVVAERQAPVEGSPASSRSGTPPDRLVFSDTGLSSAIDTRRPLLDRADCRAEQGHHLAPPPTRSPACRSRLGVGTEEGGGIALAKGVQENLGHGRRGRRGPRRTSEGADQRGSLSPESGCTQAHAPGVTTPTTTEPQEA